MTVDRDTRTVIAQLASALEMSGLSAAAFARALGTSPPRFSAYLHGTTRPSAHFVVRAQRLGRALCDAAARGLMSAPVTAREIRWALRTGREEWAWRMLLQGRDHLREALTKGPSISDAWEAAPAGTGSRSWDTLLAALAAHEFEQAGLEAPEWTVVDALAEPWGFPHPFLSDDRVRAQTPPWLAEWNIYLPARDLVTA